jgi:hypothetical protein
MTSDKNIRVCHTSSTLISQRWSQRGFRCGLTTACRYCRLTCCLGAQVNDCSGFMVGYDLFAFVTPSSAVCCPTVEKLSPKMYHHAPGCVADSTVRRPHPGSSRLASCAKYSLAHYFLNTSPTNHTDVPRYHAGQCCNPIASNATIP